MVDMQLVHDWLRDQMSPPLYRCALFGSALQSPTPNYVDILIIATEWDVRDILSNLRRGFHARFKLTLHVQAFHTSQWDKIATFVGRAGRLEVVA